MALGEAKAKAREEFERSLRRAGVKLEDVRDYVSAHPSLGSALYRVPRKNGVAGVAANFLCHVGDLIRGKGRPGAMPA